MKTGPPDESRVRGILSRTASLRASLSVDAEGQSPTVVVARTGHPVASILAAIDDGASQDELRARFVGIESEDLRAILELWNRLQREAAGGDGFDTMVLDLPEADPIQPTEHEAAAVVQLAAERSSDDRYDVQETLGRGGMGVVLRAVDRELGREVALKILSGELSAEPRYIQRFLEEAQASAQLEHPNIVPTYDVGRRPDGRLFFSMHLVRGRTLADVLEDLRAGRLRRERGFERLLAIFLKVTDAVAYAHSQGVVHRDLKPSNVMLGEFGEVLVMDWGLAKVLAETGPVGAPARRVGSGVHTLREDSDAELTRCGEVAGTLLYMSPEQARGEDADRQSDVYSLGSILYEILTLTPPFGRDPTDDIFRRIAEEVPPTPRSRVPGRRIPRELSAIAMMALAKRKADRYADVVALREDVHRYLAGESVLAAPDGPVRRVVKWTARNRNLSSLLALATFMTVLTVIVLWVQAVGDVRQRQLLSDAKDREARAMLQARDEEAVRQETARRTSYRANAADHLAAADALLARARAGLPAEPDGQRLLRELRREYEVALSWFGTLEKELPGDDGCVAGAIECLVGLAEVERLREEARETDGAYPEAIRYLEAAREADRQGRHAGRLEALLREARGVLPVHLSVEPPDVEVAIARFEGDLRVESPVATVAVAGGRHRLDLPAGRYALDVSAPGWAPVRLSLDLVRSFEANREIRLALLPADRVPEGFVHIPAGYFRLGEARRWARHETGFLIAVRELTFGAYRVFRDGAPEDKRSLLDPTALVLGGRQRVSLWPYVEQVEGWADWPVAGITVGQAAAYASWLSFHSPVEIAYRLPTSAEWEYAAGGAEGRTYPWGDAFDRARCNMADTREHQFSLLTLATCFEPVGARPGGRSVFGCYQMAGNVSEWTRTSESFGAFRIKGGSFLSPAADCRATYYQELPADAGAYHVGVRLAADLPR